MALISRPWRSPSQPRGNTSPAVSRPESGVVVPEENSAPSAAWDEPIDRLLTEFTDRWERGDRPSVEEYLPRLDPTRLDDLLVLIYREFCLAGEAGLSPTASDYIGRFPNLEERLTRLFGVHDRLGSSQLRIWDETEVAPMPRVGDHIGAYRLIRELGRGGFARVFLAVQSDLDDRLVVLKVSSRVTVEPNLLARACHPNIVDVHWHRIIEDGALHVIAMPFLGGATLSAILDHRREMGVRHTTGHGLLTELDEVGAPEYPAPRAGRPARDAIEPLSYPRAVARIVAPLAEALDFAYRRGVLHGDVKPSNVLLTADGVPMLLDFNLAVGWQPLAQDPAAQDLPRDGGGTLPYMAPERLRAVAEPGIAPLACPTPAERHRADIYSLGVLLLEMLTGRSPDLAANHRLSISQLASVYVSSRSQGGDVLIRDARGPIPAGLRAIVVRCLAPDPKDRYRRASDLAEDLDRWRMSQPLVYARESRFLPSIFRWVRRRRSALSAVGIGLALTVLAMGIAWRFAAVASAERAREKSDHFFNGTNSEAFLGRSGALGKVSNEDFAVSARRHLEYFGAFGSLDWRAHDDVRLLPRFEREELEVWLLEQSLRFAHALGTRDAPEDWRRALLYLEPVARASPFEALRAECLELRQRLKQPASPVQSGGANTPLWMDEYLFGVAAELRHEDLAAEGHYSNACSERPDSFWGNYRNAAMASFLGRRAQDESRLDAAIALFEQAVTSLKICVRQRPSNAHLRQLLAGCLFHAEKYREADDEWENASELDPDLPDIFLSRSFLRVKQGRVRDVFADISRFNRLIGWNSQDPRKRPALDLLRDRGEADGIVTGSSLLGEVNRDRPELRFSLAHELLNQPTEFLDQDARILARSELDRVLLIQPNDLVVRFYRGELLRTLDPAKADNDFLLVLRSPLFESTLSNNANRHIVVSSEHVVHSLIREGNVREAVFTALRGVQLARSVAYREFEANVVLVQAYGAQAKDEPAFWPSVVEALRTAARLNPKKCAEEYLAPEFDDVRMRLGESLADAISSIEAP